MKKYFVALDADAYKLDAIKISLSWGESISDWLKIMEQYTILEDDLVIGHSVGATIAILHGKGHIVALSPSPITEETKHLIVDIPRTDVPFIEDGTLHTLKNICADIYVGKQENDVIQKSAEIIAKKTINELTFISDANHSNIVEKTRNKWGI